MKQTISDTKSDTPQAYPEPSRVFSGMQPSGVLHLGNYLGALKEFTRLQNQMQCVFCIVDLHAITTWQDPKNLATQTRHIAAAFLAAGLDPKQAIIYNQSCVRAHTELAWYFNCIARIGWLNRMTQFKDKAGKNSENMSVGLYNYPVLQAADILAFKATHVPIGKDQKQHLELSRDIAEKFNREFFMPNFFPIPEPLIDRPGTKILSLRDGTKKMSKSDPSDNSRINLTDDADMIAQKIRRAKTDAGIIPDNQADLQGRPEITNLVTIYAALAEHSLDQVLDVYGGQEFSTFKPALAELTIEKLAPIRQLMQHYLSDPGELDRVLNAGADQAADISEPILHNVRKIIGFRGP